MKILHVCQNYYPSKGGPQYSMQHVSEKLVEYYDDQVEVATTNSLYDPASPLFNEVKPAYELVNGIPVNRYPFFRWHRSLLKFATKVKAKLTGRGLPHFLSKRRIGPDSPSLQKAMDSFDGDVIVATTAAYTYSDYPIWRHKTKNPKPFVLHGAIHLHREPDAHDVTLKRAIACDCYIANTEFEKNKLIEYGVQPYKIIAAGIGLTIEQFECSPEEIDHFKTTYHISEVDVVIGFVGRLEVGKGVAILINAIRTLRKKHKHVKLLLAGGRTTYSKEIKSIIATEQLPIILIEDFEERIKPLIFHSINIFVLPSRSESFGIVFLEAWVCKKPVIAARMGATASLINEGSDGLLFEFTDIQSLIQKVEMLINDKKLQAVIGQAGYDKVLKNYTWEKIIPKYREAYLLGIKNFKHLQQQKQ